MREVEPLFDAAKAFFDTIDVASLAGNLRLQMTDLSHDVAHRAFKSRDPTFHHAHIGLQSIDDPADVSNVLKHEIFSLLCHAAILSRQMSVSKSAGLSHSASAPEMISISSLVIIAWRERLYVSVCRRIMSPALRVALSIADICAP